MELAVDPTREGLPETGIFVRAKRAGAWGNADIVELDEPSLRTWLRSRGGQNEWAENVVLILLGYPR